MNSLRWERIKPLAYALVVSVVWYFVALPFPREIPDFLSASLSFSGILIGFLVTIQTVLVTVSGAAVVDRLKQSGYMQDLERYIKEATYSLLLFALVNLAGFFMTVTPARWFSTLWVFLCIYGLTSFFRVSNIISKILKKV